MPGFVETATADFPVVLQVISSYSKPSLKSAHFYSADTTICQRRFERGMSRTSPMQHTSLAGRSAEYQVSDSPEVPACHLGQHMYIHTWSLTDTDSCSINERACCMSVLCCKLVMYCMWFLHIALYYPEHVMTPAQQHPRHFLYISSAHKADKHLLYIDSAHQADRHE